MLLKYNTYVVTPNYFTFLSLLSFILIKHDDIYLSISRQYAYHVTKSFISIELTVLV